MERIWIVVIAAIVLLIANVISFQMMKDDKNRARKGIRRIPEKSLFVATACFGGLGGVMGMRLLRHKTKHWYFQLFFPLMLALQIALLGVGAYLLYR